MALNFSLMAKAWSCADQNPDGGEIIRFLRLRLSPLTQPGLQPRQPFLRGGGMCQGRFHFFFQDILPEAVGAKQKGITGFQQVGLFRDVGAKILFVPPRALSSRCRSSWVGNSSSDTSPAFTSAWVTL